MSIKNILMVDDEKDFAESIEELLEYSGFNVTLAHNGKDAIELSRNEHFDLVLMDMKMPGMNGIECMKILRKMHPGIRIIMITAFTQSEFVNQAMDSGALTVLSKPILPDTLINSVSSLSVQSSILVVEDNKELAEEISSLINESGYMVKNAGTLEEAKSILANDDVAIILLDYYLPDGTGAELLAWLKLNHRKVKTIVLTGYMEEALADLPFIPLNDVIKKPFNPDLLISVIKKYGSFYPPNN